MANERVALLQANVLGRQKTAEAGVREALRVFRATVAPEHVLISSSMRNLAIVLFTLNYASQYYRVEKGEGMLFPGATEHFKPGYLDFAYFSFTIAVALQTSDVAVTTPVMRRMVLVQSLLAFVFNTTILAFTINIAASLF